ncbi:MAG: S8 family serine peptidase [Eggerthellaceae bacterium]|nr:S8 family serine peptidase [Eggerthellaceae bacterium]
MRRCRSTLVAVALALACACAFALMMSPSLPSTEAPSAVQSEGTPAAPAAQSPIQDRADQGDSTAAQTSAVATADDSADYELGTVLVTLASGVTPSQALAAFAATPELADTALDEQIGDDLLKLSLPADLGVTRALEALSALPQVQAAQPNYRYRLQETAQTQAATPTTTAATPATSLSTQALTVNDPYYTSSRQWALASINAPDAWQATTASASADQVTVAVMDEGFLTYHEDLANVITNPYDAVNSKSSALAAYNPGHSSHGTHVAGIIAAEANNAKGIAGVAYNTSAFSTCKVMPIKVADSKGDISTSSLIKGYNYLLSTTGGTTVAKKLNVRAVNLSLGTSREDEYDKPDAALKSAIASAWSSGIVTVAAACNIEDDFTNTAFRSYPCDFPNVVGVISLERANNSDGVERDPSSNFNTTSQNSYTRMFFGNESKNISAPGESIYSTYTDDSSNPAINRYASLSGTSMATPVVAGTLALMFKTNPDLTASQAVNNLYATARDLTAGSGTATGWDRATGYGEVDAQAAVAAVALRISGPSEVAYHATGSYSIYVGDERQSASSFTWKSNNEKVAKVTGVTSSACTITPVGAGTATITATNGTLTATQEVTVKWPAVDAPSVVVTGTAFTCGITIAGTAEPATSWAWTSSNPSVLSITAAGRATARAEGIATLTATNTSNGFALSKKVVVAGTLDVGALDITVPNVTYTGQPRTPAPAVANGSTSLTAGVDYQVVRYESNVNAGTATVTIAGLGSYGGETTRTFTVKPASVKGATITLSATTLTYNGKTRKPTVKSVALGQNLKKGTDYTIANPGVVKGTGKITVTGTGNYKGTATAKYSVKVVKKPVYQLYNKKTAKWRYTTSTNVSAGWTSKGVAFYVPSKSTRPVYRSGYRLTTSSTAQNAKRAFYGYTFKTKPVYAHYRAATPTGRYSPSRTLANYPRKSLAFSAV